MFDCAGNNIKQIGVHGRCSQVRGGGNCTLEGAQVPSRGEGIDGVLGWARQALGPGNEFRHS
jgi:hypothetical protein